MSDKDRWEHILKTVEENAKQTEENSEAIGKLTAATQGLVDAWEAAEGVVKAGSLLGHAAKWLGGIALFSSLAALIVDKLSI